MAQNSQKRRILVERLLYFWKKRGLGSRNSRLELPLGRG
jgi:hypothetical protein